MIEYTLVCKDCANDTFYIIKEEGRDGSYEECTNCRYRGRKVRK